MSDRPLKLGRHLLGRNHVPDERDYQYADFAGETLPEDILDQPISSLIGRGWSYLLKVLRLILSSGDTPPAPGPKPPVPVPSETWADDAVLDQGQTGHCVGFGWAGWGDCLPINDGYVDGDAHKIYYEAKIIDGQPGQENGSSVRSGAKAMKNRGRLSAYAFCANTAEVIDALQHGPVVFGTDWLNDMFTPDAQGFVSVTGPVEGGHCYLCIGYDAEAESFRFRNSWGTSWGVGGDFFMRHDDVTMLLAENGEACVAVELAA